MDRLDDIQTALKLFKKWEKFEIHFMTILELAELFKTMYRPGFPDPVGTFFDSLKDRDVKF